MLKGDDENMIFSIYLTRVYLSLDFPELKLLVCKDLFNIMKYKLETIQKEEILVIFYYKIF